MQDGPRIPPLTDVVVVAGAEDVGLIVGVSHHTSYVRLEATGQLVRQVFL